MEEIEVSVYLCRQRRQIGRQGFPAVPTAKESISTVCVCVCVHVYSRITGEKEFISSQIFPDVVALCHGTTSEDAAAEEKELQPKLLCGHKIPPCGPRHVSIARFRASIPRQCGNALRQVSLVSNSD